MRALLYVRLGGRDLRALHLPLTMALATTLLAGTAARQEKSPESMRVPGLRSY